MISNLHPHPAYKPSGVPWLGDVPSHWEVRRLRTVADMRVSNVDKHAKEDEFPVRLCNYVDVYKHDRITPAMPFMTATASRDEIERFRLERDDVLITKDSEAWDDIGVPALVTEAADDLLSGYHLALLRPFKAILGAYLARTLQSKGVAYQFHIRANGVTRYGLTHTGIKSVWLPLPPLPEQTAIVRYLDHVDRHIRRHVSAKRKLIALLEEEKQAVVNRAVTHGLDPDVRLKPSGVEWLGDMPEHWEVAALRHRYSQSLGKMLDTKRITGDHLLPYLRNTDVQWDRINVGDLPSMDIPTSQYDQYTVQQGDLLVCEGGEVGRSALWSGQLTRCGFQKALHRLRPRNPAQDMPRFMYYALRSAAKGHAFSDGHVSTIAHLTGEKLRAHRFPFPPLAEQAAIVEHLDEAIADIDSAISRVSRQIQLVEEYRTRLIADVVTGKLDVREAAAQLPDEADEDDSIDEDRPLEDDMEGDLYGSDESAGEPVVEGEVTA